MIDLEERLRAFALLVQAAEWVAVDTEADSLHAYPEKLCLLQISLPGADELIDPLAGLNLNPLLETLKGKELLLHGADYDLRLLRRAYGFVPGTIFDTMEAARLLGHREFGLLHLVDRYLGVALQKGPQKANWASRPLNTRMQDYARDDTRHLKPLADLLKAELLEKGRLSWHAETCARVVANCAQPRAIDPDQTWRLSGSQRLDRVGLAVLREVWSWREEHAIKANKPPYFILSHEAAVALASISSSHPRETPHPWPRSVPPHHQPALLAAIKRALDLAPDARPVLRRPTHRPRTETEKRRFEAIKQRRDLRAAELRIDPTLLASRATLELLAENEANYEKELMAWQRELLR